MLDCLKQPWAVKPCECEKLGKADCGQWYVEGADGMSYTNLSKDVALHIVKLHNDYLSKASAT